MKFKSIIIRDYMYIINNFWNFSSLEASKKINIWFLGVD